MLECITTLVLLIKESLFSLGNKTVAWFEQRAKIPIHLPFLFINSLGLSNIKIMQRNSYIYVFQPLIFEWK